MMRLEEYIRSVPGFPKEGIVFKDITTLLAEPDAFRSVIETWAERLREKDTNSVLAIEARGFIFGAALAYVLEIPLILARKAGKLPWSVIREEYSLEYGVDSLELHEDAVKHGDRVAVVDDLLATGGTALATVRLVERLGGEVVDIGFLIELAFLKGRERLSRYEVESFITYMSEE